MKRPGTAIVVMALSAILTGCQTGFWHAEKPRNQLLAELADCRQKGGSFRKDPASGHFTCFLPSKGGTSQ